ncbi:MAG: hypothetical protein LBJ31_02370 [Treponema sp.]|jgi:hypothetical protein|nr:hypothetical protein [Treponema sp.]
MKQKTIKKTLVFAAVFALSVPVLTAQERSSDPAVYLAGGYFDVDDRRIPCYWNGGTRTPLALPAESEGGALFITVSEGEVYAAGAYRKGGDYVPCYWSGGAVIPLAIPAGFTGGYARSVTVSDGGVYVTGYCEKDGGMAVCSWNADGTLAGAAVLAEGGYTRFVTVSGGAVYAAGYYKNPDGNDVACYWKVDGTSAARTDLGDGTGNSNACSVTVSDGGVYAAGYDDGDYYRLACYWKADGTDVVKTDLGDGTATTEAFFIVLQNGKPYVAGTYNDILCYWSCGTMTLLPLPAGAENGFVDSVAVSGGGVYVAGSYTSAGATSRTACYWSGETGFDLFIAGCGSPTAVTVAE